MIPHHVPLIGSDLHYKRALVYEGKCVGGKDNKCTFNFSVLDDVHLLPIGTVHILWRHGLPVKGAFSIGADHSVEFPPGWTLLTSRVGDDLGRTW